MVLQNTGKYRSDREDSNKKDAGTSSGGRFVHNVSQILCKYDSCDRTVRRILINFLFPGKNPRNHV